MSSKHPDCSDKSSSPASEPLAQDSKSWEIRHSFHNGAMDKAPQSLGDTTSHSVSIGATRRLFSKLKAMLFAFFCFEFFGVLLCLFLLSFFLFGWQHLPSLWLPNHCTLEVCNSLHVTDPGQDSNLPQVSYLRCQPYLIWMISDEVLDRDLKAGMLTSVKTLESYEDEIHLCCLLECIGKGQKWDVDVQMNMLPAKFMLNLHFQFFKIVRCGFRSLHKCH